MLQIQLLGQFDVRSDGKRVVIPSRAGQSLFAFLVLNAGVEHRRERLAGLFWSESSDENARKYLRQELWRIRKALSFPLSGDGDLIVADELAVSLNPSLTFRLDVAELEKPADNLETLISNLSHYRGELLPGFYDDWVVLERERLHSRFEQQMQQLLQRLLQDRRWTTALEWGDKWIALGQTPEPAYRALMVAYAALGNRAQVVMTYERCQKALEKDLGVDPSDETRGLYEQIMRGETVARVDWSSALPPFRLNVPEEPPAPGESPFKGLQYFGEEDADLFFGREALTATLVGRLRESQLLMVVVGASGSGKSSIVRAGLIAALKSDKEKLEAGEWKFFVLTPTAHPLEALAMALTRASESVTATATFMDDLANDPRALYLYLRRQNEQAGRPDSGPHHPSPTIRHLLVVDQFEELFTLCHDTYEREAFIDNLLYALGEAGKVVLTLRADFYAHLAQYPELRDAVAKHQEYIGPMNAEELRRAIQEPAKQRHAADGAPWEFEPGLVDLLLRDVGDEPGALPLLSHALLETWKRRSGHTLTLKGYHDAGGVRGAIAQTAETVYGQLSPEQQTIARNIFLRLTQLGEGTEDTRRRASLAEMIPQGADGTVVRDVLSRLADARLVTTSEKGVEVAHEALIRGWARLSEWLNQDREGLRLHRQLTDSAREWDLMEGDASMLYRGVRLAQARDWAEQNPGALNARERAFLEASEENETRGAREREEQQRRELEAATRLAAERTRSARRLRWFAAGLGAFLLLALGAGYLAFNSSVNAQNNFVTAERIRLASQAQIALNNGEGGDVPALLSLRSLKYGYSSQADAALLNALGRGFTARVFAGHTDLIFDLDFSPDGKYVATGGGDATVRIWDVQTGKELLKISPPVRIVNAIEYSPDGKYLLSGSPGPITWLWDARTGKPVQEFKGSTGGTWEVKFSPDGRYVITGDDHLTRLWDVRTGTLVRELNAHIEGEIIGGNIAVTFSPDGKTIATGEQDGTIRTWDVETGQQLTKFNTEGNSVYIEYSPDGKTLVSISGKIAQLFDTVTGKEIHRLVGHTELTAWAGFSPDGRMIVTASHDKTLRLWDAATGQELHQFFGHTGPITTVTFSPDGRYILAGSEDRTARLWDVTAETEPHLVRTVEGGPALFGNAFTPFLSPDGQSVIRYAQGDQYNKALTIWNTKTGEYEFLHPELKRLLQTISVLAFSPDNRLLFGGGDDGVAWLWDAKTGKELFELNGHSAPVRAVLFSPDGRMLLSASEDMTARLWDAQTGKLLQQFAGHTEPVRAIAFSPDGRFVLTGSDDKTARLWDTQTGKELKQFTGHSAPLRGVAFSPDAKFIVTGGDDQSARIWDVATGQEIKQLIGHTGQVSQVAFSPDGQFVLTGSADQTARLWIAASGQLVRNFVGHVSPVLYIGFTDNGRTIITGDTQNAYRRRASLDDVIAFTCEQLTRDLTEDERALYGITEKAATCAK